MYGYILDFLFCSFPLCVYLYANTTPLDYCRFVSFEIKQYKRFIFFSFSNLFHLFQDLCKLQDQAVSFHGGWGGIFCYLAGIALNLLIYLGKTINLTKSGFLISECDLSLQLLGPCLVSLTSNLYLPLLTSGTVSVKINYKYFYFILL